MDVTVRPATEADVDRLCAVTRAAIEAVDNPYDDRQRSAWAGAVEPDLFPIETDETSVLIAADDDRVVGVGWTAFDTADYFAEPVGAELGGLYVEPSSAGHGVGTTLYERLETSAREAGADAIGLWSSLNAVSFYERRGYMPVMERSIEYDDATVPVLEMRKSIA